jgi:hypothetical protein
MIKTAPARTSRLAGGSVKTYRYLRLIAGMVTGSYGTLDELYQAELRRWKRQGFKSSSLDWVDTWNEPGRVVADSGLVVWEPA